MAVCTAATTFDTGGAPINSVPSRYSRHRGAVTASRAAHGCGPGATSSPFTRIVGDPSPLRVSGQSSSAVSHSVHTAGTPDSCRQFNDIISEFVFHVYKHAQACPRKLNRSQACDEAVDLLEQAYEGTHANGYHAALLDATDTSQGGMDVVLSRITDIIKSRLRQNYRRWVFAHCIDPSDWRAKCDIAAILLDRCSPLPPGKQGSYYAEQFVDHISELFDAVLSIEQLEQQGSFASFAPGS